MRNRAMKRKRQSGQSLLEYVLLMMVIAGFGGLAVGLMPRALNALESPIRKKYKRIYQQGFEDACGYDDTDPPCTGTPNNHIRVSEGHNFRLFGRETGN